MSGNEANSSSMALLTDLYQLTMAYGYWKLGRAEQETVFHLFFRKPPFSGGYAIAAGIGPALQYLREFRFDETDIEYLKTLVGNDSQPLFDRGFLEYLANLRLSVDVDAVPEGTVVFGQEPLLRVKGPILQCQLLESALLNIINFQTLIATKATRVTAAAGDDSVLEFGLRRAQGVDGALAASRAAYIGGCAATSNVLAGKLYDIPVKGTHAHSWVMSFDTETESFERYAEVMPNNCVFLVDTYDTLEGVRRAVEVGRKLRDRGHEMAGIRLDSGDLAYLSIEARRILDDAGFADAAIVASNDLDEHIIENLRGQKAKIAVWGVGTKLATGYDQPALGGVYKLGALRRTDGTWQSVVKLSEQAAKVTIPGILQVRRYLSEDGLMADMIYDELTGIDDRATIVDSRDPTRHRRLSGEVDSADLLAPAVRDGEVVLQSVDLHEVRRSVQKNLQELHPSIRRLMNPHEFPVGLDIGLQERRNRMISEARNASSEGAQ